MLDDWKRLLMLGSPQDFQHRRTDTSLRNLCGKLVHEKFTIPNCTSFSDEEEDYQGEGYEDNHKHCLRDYDLYIPSAACEREHYHQTNVLPLVVAVHCFGCNSKDMHYLADYAEYYSFILVIPWGIGGSFNAEQCCGEALEHNVDDVGFFDSLIGDLSLRWHGNLVSPELVYGFGWSNGGYMVVNAAHLFRAIAPVSGYQVYEDPAQGLSNLVEQIAHRPIGLFLHHSRDDQKVAITGCCTDASMPECCCGLSRFVDQCQPMTDFVDIFAKTLNHCEGEPTLTLEQSYTSERAKVTCYQAGDNCWTNTTYCIHDHRGHFNRPSLGEAFPMMNDVSDFFARDACETVGGGSWSSKDGLCSCKSVNETYTFCLDQDWEGRYQAPDWTHYKISDGGNLGAIGMAVLIILAFITLFVLAKQERKYRQFKAVSTFELSEFSVDPRLDDGPDMNSDFANNPKPVFTRPSLSRHI